MSNARFGYFRDPDNFAFRTHTKTNCSICHSIGVWFDGSGFYGPNEIDCICDKCLLAGKLKDLGITTNAAVDGNRDAIETIVYRTPALPTWQDRHWPFVNGDYCIFEKIASKPDFDGKTEFLQCFSDRDRENTDLDWLWELLPDRKITNLREGNYDVSVYLFTSGGKKLCIWDSS